MPDESEGCPLADESGDALEEPGPPPTGVDPGAVATPFDAGGLLGRNGAAEVRVYRRLVELASNASAPTSPPPTSAMISAYSTAAPARLERR